MGYEMFEWKYRDLKEGVSFVVYARTRETADEIVSIINTDNDITLKPALFFKRKVIVDVPPYDFEQEQIQTSLKRLEHRRRYWEEHPEERPGYRKKKTRVK